MVTKRRGPYSKYIKRILDIILSLFSIFLFGWVYIIIGILVYLNLGAPILFSQNRPGKNGKIFKLYKFRSMSNEMDANGELLPDKERVNRFGKILRASSLDELPEVFNILKGDMSLIGPRPLLTKYLIFYNSCENRRHLLRPGLTGLAQISGRNAATWKHRFQKDIEYIDNVSFILDAKIFFLTIKKIFAREGIEYNNASTIEDYFMSSDRLTDETCGVGI